MTDGPAAAPRSLPGRRLTFVTRNPGKVRELAALLAPARIEVAQDARGYPEVQAETLEAVCRFGARHLLQSGLAPPFVLEDSGLFVRALRGFPGVYSRHALDTIGVDGVLRLLAGTADRFAWFETCLWLQAGPDQGQGTAFVGRCDGTVAAAAAGAHGFGFDPVFRPEGSAATFAQMGGDAKNAVSHRGKAVRALLRHLLRNSKDINGAHLGWD